MKIKPLHDRVIVKRIEEDQKTKGGIIIPDTAKEKPQEGEVIAVGSGARDESGKLVPLDVEYEKHPIQYMVPDADSGVVMESSPVWEGVKEAVVNNGYDVSCVGEIERTKFYEKAGRAYVTVCTSETKPYGCIILQKGVL